MTVTTHVKESELRETRALWSLRYVVEPCACGANNCEGWAMLLREHLEEHRKLYGPKR